MPDLTPIQKAHAARRAAQGKSAEELISKALRDLIGTTAGVRIICRVDEMPVSSRAAYIKALRGVSPTTGIKAHCMECMGWIRLEVKRCPLPNALSTHTDRFRIERI